MSTGTECESDDSTESTADDSSAAGTRWSLAAATPEACDTPARKLFDMVSIPLPRAEEEQPRSASSTSSRRTAGRRGSTRSGTSARQRDAVLLTSHIDTVPGDIPVEVQPAAEDDEVGKPGEPVLWGRGTVDATGPLVAMAVAAVQTGVSFVGVAGEETKTRGAHDSSSRTATRRRPW